jgi:cystathionine beta-lyase family protein involved in aluminum resistance
MEQTDRDLLTEIKSKIDVLESKLEHKLKNLETKIDERKENYISHFESHKERIDQNAKDVNEAFTKLHVMEKDLTKNNENTMSLIDRVEKLEIAVVNMKETLIRVSVISGILTAAITALVVKYFVK